MANIARLMAAELASGDPQEKSGPSEAKVAREAKYLMQEMVSEFVGFITSEANDLAVNDSRKAITERDIRDAFVALGPRAPLSLHPR